jgi:hypothetical protein
VRFDLQPLTLKEANTLVSELHRHHKPAQGHRFSLGLYLGEELVGAVIVGRPVARGCNYKEVAEVTRLVTNGTKNACSFLYAAAARVAKEMGFKKIQSYILEDEPGTSLIATGWEYEYNTAGGNWNSASFKNRRTDQPMCPKQLYSKVLK